jgi:type I restriction enzyme M protein
MLDDIKKTLWATADKLRANMDTAEYKHLVLGLIFVKYVSDTFAARRAELTRRFADESDDYFLHDCDAELLAAELEDRDYYREVNVFWVPESARWEAIRAAAKQPGSFTHRTTRRLAYLLSCPPILVMAELLKMASPELISRT